VVECAFGIVVLVARVGNGKQYEFRRCNSSLETVFLSQEADRWVNVSLQWVNETRTTG
jgi:hypothetical protein